MKNVSKLIALVICALMVFSLAACGTAAEKPADAKAAADTAKGPIKVGIVNNPPSESGYRAANVADFEKVFTEANGYKVSTFYSRRMMSS